MPRHPRQTFSDSLSILQQNYLRRVAGYIADVRRLSELLEKGYLPFQELQKIFLITHNLMGSGATFGFPRISSTAQALHNAISECLEGGDASRRQANLVSKLKPFVEACVEAVNQQMTGRKPKQKNPSLLFVKPAAMEKTVYLAGDPSGGFQKLADRLMEEGFTTREVDSVEELNRLLEETRPHAIVISTDDAMGELPKLRTHHWTGDDRGPFLAVITPAADFASRLAALRAGATAFLPPETDPGHLIRLIARPVVQDARIASSKRVLILDEDETSGAFYAHSLRQAGYEIAMASSAMQALDLVTSGGIDVLFTAWSLAECSGQELAVIVRQSLDQPAFPIIFNVDRAAYEAMPADFRSGAGNVFLIKPFSPTQLISLISQLQTTTVI